jgi:hypothetical protein
MIPVPFETADLESPEESMTRGSPKRISRDQAVLEKPEKHVLVLRHLGGALREVDVLEATPDGALHVHWRGSVGSLPYVVHVLRQWPPPPKSKSKTKNGGSIPPPPIAGHVDEPPPRGTCLLWKSSRAKTPLAWSAMVPEEATRLWRTMMKKDD